MAMNRTHVMLGGVLVVIGLLSLLHNLRLFWLSEEYVLSMIFAGSGIVLMHHGRTTLRKWAYYLGAALVVVGAIIFIDEAAFLPDEMIGTLWLWLLAGVLYRVHQLNHNRWWVLMIAGPAFVVGLVVLLDGFGLMRGPMPAVLINLGIAGTFAYLYLLRLPERKSDWAKYPAAVFFLIAVYIFLAKEFHGALPFVLSGMFILAGLYLIYRTVRTDFGSSGSEHNDPATEAPQAS